MWRNFSTTNWPSSVELAPKSRSVPMQGLRFELITINDSVMTIRNSRHGQARNQRSTPGEAKSFLRGAQIFWTMSNSFKRCPTHFSRGGEKFPRVLWPPWLRAWTQDVQRPCRLRVTRLLENGDYMSRFWNSGLTRLFHPRQSFDGKIHMLARAQLQ